MKTALTLFLTLFSLLAMAQEQLNDYKYIVVPKKFEDFKRQNQYQTSTLVKHLFSEQGFEAVYEDKLPQDLKSNGCLGLRAKLVDGSSMFTTKASIVLENCNGEEVFATREGKSKEKDYKDSYGEAIRDALSSLDSFNYAYNGKAGNSSSVSVDMANDVREVAEERRRNHSSANRPDILVEQEATRENQRYVDRRPRSSKLEKAVPADETSEKSTSRTDRTYRDNDTAASNSERTEANLSDIAAGTLYAQEVSVGYQLVDNTPKIRMKIHKTSMPDFYLAEAEGTNGVVFEKNGTWFFEYYSGGNLVTEELDIKF